MSASRPEKPERQVQDDLVRLDAYRGQLNAIAQQHQILSASRQDHLRARESLEGIDRAESGTEFLFPLGGEAFVRGTVVAGSPILIGIGSGIVIELDRPKGIELLAQRVGRIDDAVTELEGQMGALEERIQQVSRRLETASRKERSPADVGGS